MPSSGFDCRYRFRRACGIAHAAIGGQPVLGDLDIVEPGQQVAVTLGPRQYFVVSQLTQAGVVQFFPRARRGDGRHRPAT
ncbi:Uncharacterised protein [Mycobacteroides abscessus subsp. abscessus]|nr:Uncharacterised protein [Mycobacteroides abscessus subsp. abscessus]